MTSWEKSHFTRYQLYNKGVGQCENITSCTGWPRLHAKATASAFIQKLSPGKNLTHTKDQIVSLFLPGCFALCDPFFCRWGLISLYFFFFLPLFSDAMGRRALILQWGSPATAAVYSTVTVCLSHEDTMFNNGCPQGLNRKLLYAHQYIVVKPELNLDAFKHIWTLLCILCYVILCYLMLLCVIYNCTSIKAELDTDMHVWQLHLLTYFLPWQYRLFIPPTPGNWVGAISLSSSGSQSAELSAESSHMSYLGLCFPPPRVKIDEAEGGTKTNHMIGPLRVTSLWLRGGLFS